MKRPALWLIVLAGLALVVLLLWLAEAYRSSHVKEQFFLSVSFEHSNHTKTPCAQCHHNFTDQTGGGTCYNCHKYSPDVMGDMEKTFHDFCFGCHVTKRLEGEDSGPMRECSGCH
ncbi:MAG: hypothetical protein IMF06_08090 [Proteobacteria bacterium]|nr:hypothetical protein [Pseudomonadota bacterium]